MQRTRSLTIPCLILLLSLLAAPAVALPSGDSVDLGSHLAPSLDAWFARLVSLFNQTLPIAPYESGALELDGRTTSEESGESDPDTSDSEPVLTPQAGPQIDPDG